MGTKSRASASSQALFSPVQAATLGLLFGHPDERFRSSDIIRRVGSGSGAVQRQLAALLAADLVSVTSMGNQKHYQANRLSPVFHELHGLVLKTVTFVDPLRDALMTLEAEISTAFVFGSVADGTARASSDLDVMVIKRDGSALDHASVYEALRAAEERLGRRIEPVLMSEADWRRKRQTPGSFAARVSLGAKLMLVGEDNAAVSTRESR